MPRLPQPDSETTDENPWVKSSTPNLYRYGPSGVYFARAKVGGKLIRQSLKTKKRSIAVEKLSDLLKQSRGLVEAQDVAVNGAMTFQQAADLFLQQIDADPSLKPSTRAYRRRCLKALLKAWPNLAWTDCKKITSAQCREWSARFAANYSPTMYNNTVGTLRMILDVAIKAGVRSVNPAKEVNKVKVPLKKLILPTLEEFNQLIRVIAEGGGRFSRDSADLVAFLAYGGFRKSEAAAIQWSDCDFTRGTIFVAGADELGLLRIDGQ